MTSFPRRLYKYRAFSNRALDMLVADRLYFSSPADFNDPLDCQPNVEIDIGFSELLGVVGRLVERRLSAELTAAARTLKYRGPKTSAHIARHSQDQARGLINRLHYDSGNPLMDEVADETWIFKHHLEEELRTLYDSGIVSFGSRATCPLMWSHYGDQHRGICIGYSVPDDDNVHEALRKVDYGGDRNVMASDIAKMDDDDAAKRRVEDAVLLRKAKSWSYEREWRLVGLRGVSDSPLELEEVVFGLRCDPALKFTIFKAMADRERPIKFYEMRTKRGSFRLQKSALDIDELQHELPRRAPKVFELFSSIPEGDGA